MPVRLPGSDVLGERPTPRAGRNVVTYQPSGVGRAVEAMGRVVGEVGEEHDREQDAQAVFAARRQLDDWERATIFDPEKGAIARRGKDAFALTQTLPMEFDKAAGMIGAGLSSERQRKAFRELAQSRREQVGAWATRHAGREREAYDEGQFQADLKSFADRAALFPDKAAVELAMMKTRTVGYLRGKGRSEEEIEGALKEQGSAIHGRVLASMLNAGNGEGAKAYLEANKAGMTADAALRAEGALKEVTARGKAQAFGDEAMGKGLTLEQALAEARTKFSGTEEDAAIQEIKTRFAEREVVKSRDEKANSDTAWKVIAGGGGRKDIPADVWNRLDGREQAQIVDHLEARWRRAQADAKGKDVTDMSVYYGLRLMAAEQPDAFAKIDLIKSQPMLSDANLKQLIDLQGSINKGDLKAMESQRTVKRTLALVKGEIAAAGIDLTPKEGSAKAKQTEAFLGSVTQALDQAMSAKGGPLTDQEARRVGMSLLRESYEQGSGFFGLFPTKKRGFEIPEDERGRYVSTPYDKIPPAIRAEIEADLYPKGRSAGIYGTAQPVDKARVERIYSRALAAGKVQ